MRVTAVLVNYNSAPDIFECIESLRAQTHPVAIVVVDNASADGSPDALAALDDVTLIRSERNLGFGAGVNLGVERSDVGDAVLLVNPDATLDPTAVAVLVETMSSDERIGAVGPLVCNPDGSVQPSKRRFPAWWQAAMHATVGVFWPDNPGTRAYVCADAPADRAVPVGWLSGSILLLREQAFTAVGGFDERFFFYVEDVDLCRRLADDGWELWFEPRARAVHAWGGSTSNRTRQLWQHHSNLFRYVRKHQRGWRVVTYPFVIGGLAVRFALLYLRGRVLGHRLPSHHATTARD